MHSREVDRQSRTGLIFLLLVTAASEFRRGHPPARALNTGGVHKFRDFLPISRYISQTMQDIAIITIEVE